MLLKRAEMVFNYRRADVCGQPASFLYIRQQHWEWCGAPPICRPSDGIGHCSARPFINNVKFTPAS